VTEVGILDITMNYTELDPSECDFYSIGPIDDLPNGERIFAEIGDRYLVIFNIGGNIYAVEDVCSHDDGPLGDGDLEEYEIICPRHGARFDIRTGKALSFPAVTAIPAYPVQIQAGMILVGLPKN
jgi:3-phenylpropionate/trans-cinnamate dioxygenase ferredoxin subunit